MTDSFITPFDGGDSRTGLEAEPHSLVTNHRLVVSNGESRGSDKVLPALEKQWGPREPWGNCPNATTRPN